MAGSIFSSLNDAVSGVFPERRVYIRSDQRTRYWTFNPISQCGFALVVTGFLGWSAFTSMAFIDKAMDGRTAENQLETVREAYEAQLAAMSEQQRLLEEELNRSNGRGDAVTAELSDKQRLLVRTANDLSDAQAELTGLRVAFESIVTERRAEQDQLNHLNEELVSLRIALADAETKSGDMTDVLETFAGTMGDVIVERDVSSARASELDGKVVALQSEIVSWERRQQSLLAQLEDAAEVGLSSLDKVFQASDIDLNSILKEAKRDYSGRGGGPVDDDTEDHSAASPDDEERIAALMNNIDRVNLMRVAIDRLPFGEPTRGASRTSGFGPRRDPIRRSYRQHKGVDFAAPRGTPIYSTAQGVVSFSGRQSGYGIVVKIRHAFGFETVYAHLNKSRVKVGQQVARGDRIADMGSTGRSTGSHLHYEIRIDGKPVNPSKFIKAARNVL